MDLNLKGKRAVVTGGSRGIGREIALAFAREGAEVCIPYIGPEEEARETIELLKKAGAKNAAAIVSNR